MDYTLLEKGIPTDELDKLAKREKLGKPPISEMHYWWTRKPLIINRGLLLATSQRLSIDQWKNLVGLDSNSTFRDEPWRLSQGQGNLKKEYEEFLGEIKQLYDGTLFDPFAGSGMIGFEALRLGFRVVVSDYNPVAYLIMKATLDYPIKYGKKLREDVETYARQIETELKQELGQFYPANVHKKVLAYIWAFEVKCNSCGRMTPLVNDWTLGDVRGASKYISYQVNGDSLNFKVADGKPPEGNVSRAEGTCLFCGRKISNDEIVESLRKDPRERLLAVVVENREFDSPSPEDEEAFERAKQELIKRKAELAEFLPDVEIPPERGVIRAAKYLPLWKDLFNARQLLLFASMAKKISEKTNELAKRDLDYARAVGTYLSMWLAKAVDRSSRVTHWDSSNKQVGDSMSLRGLGMTWRYTEPNPFEKFSGCLDGMLSGVLDGLDFAIDALKGPFPTPEKPLLPAPNDGEANFADEGRVIVRCASALDLPDNQKYKLIVTDPPYFDDVPYGELSEFFYVWHRLAIGHLYGDLFATEHVDTSEEIDVGGNRTEEDYIMRFKRALSRLRESLTDDGLLVLFFAHRSSEKWASVVNALNEAGFSITSAIPIESENENNVVARGKRSVYYSLIMTARKRVAGETATLVQVREEVKSAIIKERDHFRQLGYKGGKQYLAAVGVALKVLTRYSDIESFNKEDTAKTALDLANEAIRQLAVRDLYYGVNKKDVSLDPETDFYLLALSDDGRDLDSDALNQYVKSFGLDEDRLYRSGLLRKAGINGRAVIRIEGAFDRATFLDEEPHPGAPIITVVQKLIRDYSSKKDLKLVDRYSSSSSVPAEILIGVARVLASLGQTEKLKGDRECAEASHLSDDWHAIRESSRGQSKLEGFFS